MLTELGEEMPTTHKPTPFLLIKKKLLSAVTWQSHVGPTRGWLTETDLRVRGTAGLLLARELSEVPSGYISKFPGYFDLSSKTEKAQQLTRNS